MLNKPFHKMQQLKIDKRIAEELDGIKKLAAYLPTGKANALLNKCAKIGAYARKGQALIEAPQGSLFPREVHAGDINTNEDIAARYVARRAIFEAMKTRKVSLEDSARFRVSQMHTQISCIRREIEDKGLPWILCDEEVRRPDRRGYKRYWLIPKEDAV